MIIIQDVYSDVRNILRKDSGAGYFSNEEFMRYSVLAENALFDYYLSFFETDRVIARPLMTFHKEAEIAKVNGIYALPADYRSRKEVLVKVVEVIDCETSVSWYHAKYIAEKGLALQSALRKPSLVKRKFYFEEYGTYLNILPEEYDGGIKLNYFREITYGSRVVTIDTNAQEEIPNTGSGNYRNYEWDASERGNLVDLILFYLGLSLRESPVVEWVAAKNKAGNMPGKILINQ